MNINLIILFFILIALSAITPFLNPFFRTFRKKEYKNRQEISQESFPPISVILCPRNNPQRLQETLPHYLKQNYPGKYKVIVVIERKDTEIENVLKQFTDNKHLYVTFIPKESKYISFYKLAITIGVKAANSEWVLCADSNEYPNSSRWLTLMSSHFNQHTKLVLGYSSYEKSTSSFYQFFHIRKTSYFLREAYYYKPFRIGGSNLAFKKSDFLKGKGFRGNLDLQRGEYDFIANKYGERQCTEIEIKSDSWLINNKITPSSWRSKILFDIATCKKLRMRWRLYILFFLDTILMLLCYILQIGTIVYCINSLNSVLATAATILFISTILLRIHIANRRIRELGGYINKFYIPIYELYLPLYSIWNWIKYIRTDKYNFSTHKI